MTYTHGQTIALDDLVYAARQHAAWAARIERRDEAALQAAYWAMVADHHALRLTLSLAGVVAMPMDEGLSEWDALRQLVDEPEEE